MPNRHSHTFELRLLGWSEVHELPGNWPSKQLATLLEHLEVEDVTESDALDMALMALQDLDADDAADLVMQTVFEDMSAGVRQNLIHDLEDDRPWDGVADLSRQHGILSAVTLLQKAFPTRFGKPDFACVEISVQAKDAQGEQWLSEDIDPALLLRLLAADMDDRAVLRRLFSVALEGDSFPDADNILWQIERRSAAGVSPFEAVIHSSLRWFEPLKQADSWTATGWPDSLPKIAEA